MLGWLKNRKPTASLDVIDAEALAASATQGMPTAEHIRQRALPQLYELLEAEIARVEAEQNARFSNVQIKELRSAFANAVLGQGAPQSKIAQPAAISLEIDHLSHVEGIVAQAFSVDFDGSHDQALEVATAARKAVVRYFEANELDDPALRAGLERAIAEHMAAVLR